MSLALALIALYCCTAIVSWFAGMLLPMLSRGPLAITASVLLLVPGVALFANAPIHVIGIDGEEAFGFLFLAAPSFLVGLVGLTLAILARAKLRPFGTIE